MAAQTKDGLLGQLEHYRTEDVRDVLGRVSGAIGEVNAPSIDLAEHALRVTCAVLRGRWRHELQRDYGPRFASTRGVLWLSDEDGIVLDVSNAAAASLGYKREELVGHSYEQLKAPGQDWEALRAELAATGGGEGVALVRHKSGAAVELAYKTRVLKLAGGSIYLSSFRVIASTARPLRELAQRARRAVTNGIDVGAAVGFMIGWQAGCPEREARL